MLVYFWKLVSNTGWQWLYIAYVYNRKCFKEIRNIYVFICIIHLYSVVMNMYNLYKGVHDCLSSNDFKIIENLQKLWNV